MKKPRSYWSLTFFLTLSCLIMDAGFLFGQTLVITVAGITSSAGFSGDGGPALSAQFNGPIGLCFDASGNMYTTDCLNNRIRKVDAVTGTVSTIAGTGVAGFSGDGGPAVNARIDQPLRMICDKKSHIFFVDYFNHRIRMIDLVSGIISTVAGNGTLNYASGAPAVNNGLKPSGLAMDNAGNLFIAQDLGSLYSFPVCIISKLYMTTGTIFSVAGNGIEGFAGDGGPALLAQFFDPQGMSFDAAGNLYIADAINCRIRRIDAVSGNITTIAGDAGGHYNSPDGTLAVNASFRDVGDVLIDGKGNIFLTDRSDDRIVKIDLSTGKLTNIAGNGYVAIGPDCVSPTAGGMGDLNSLALDAAGNLYFTETDGERIRKLITGPNALSPISIATASPSVCAGDLTAITLDNTANSSGSYSFQWTVNGKNAGTNSTTFNALLNDGDIVNCNMSASAIGACLVNSSITSNNLTIRVLPSLPPAISISTPSTRICTGSAAKFVATASNAGATPAYQWTLNGSPVGSNSDVYMAAGLANNDVVACQLTVDPGLTCNSSSTAISAPVTITVTTRVLPSIQINASANSICEGDTVVFTSTVQHAGNSPSYQWLLNGVDVGVDQPDYNSSRLKDGDIITCELTADDPVCSASAPLSSDPVVLTVKQVPVITLFTKDTTVAPGDQLKLAVSVTGNLQSWQWSPADELADQKSLDPTTLPIRSTTSFQLTVLSTDGCMASRMEWVKVYFKLAMPGSFTPNGDGRNDLFRIPPSITMQLKEFVVFDRWGNRLFNTNDIGQGWDGSWKGKRCPPGTYVYYVIGSDIRGGIRATGTVILLR